PGGGGIWRRWIRGRPRGWRWWGRPSPLNQEPVGCLETRTTSLLKRRGTCDDLSVPLSPNQCESTLPPQPAGLRHKYPLHGQLSMAAPAWSGRVFCPTSAHPYSPLSFLEGLQGRPRLCDAIGTRYTDRNDRSPLVFRHPHSWRCKKASDE